MESGKENWKRWAPLTRAENIQACQIRKRKLPNATKIKRFDNSAQQRHGTYANHKINELILIDSQVYWNLGDVGLGERLPERANVREQVKPEAPQRAFQFL